MPLEGGPMATAMDIDALDDQSSQDWFDSLPEHLKARFAHRDVAQAPGDRRARQLVGRQYPGERQEDRADVAVTHVVDHAPAKKLWAPPA